MMTRIIAVFVSFTFTLFFAAMFPTKNVAAEEQPLPPIDVIILVDVSGSMRFTDPKRIVLSSVADFIDKLPPDVSRVGIIGFSGRIQHRIPFMYTDAERKSWLRDELAQFVYVGYTDIGLAFMYAIDMIEDVAELNNPLIIFTSDGYIEISRLNPARTPQMSYADIEAALDTLDGMVPIYTIGMHNPDGIDVALLDMIATRSGGLSKFTYNAEELPDIFASIFDHHLSGIQKRLQAEIYETVDPEEEEIEANYEDEALELAEEVVDEEPPADVYYEDEVYEAEAVTFALGVLHYLAMFFGLTAFVSILRFIKIAL